jgi:hypothetical protein
MFATQILNIDDIGSSMTTSNIICHQRNNAIWYIFITPKKHLLKGHIRNNSNDMILFKEFKKNCTLNCNWVGIPGLALTHRWSSKSALSHRSGCGNCRNGMWQLPEWHVATAGEECGNCRREMWQLSEWNVASARSYCCNCRSGMWQLQK